MIKPPQSPTARKLIDEASVAEEHDMVASSTEVQKRVVIYGIRNDNFWIFKIHFVNAHMQQKVKLLRLLGHKKHCFAWWRDFCPLVLSCFVCGIKFPMSRADSRSGQAGLSDRHHVKCFFNFVHFNINMEWFCKRISNNWTYCNSNICHYKCFFIMTYFSSRSLSSCA